MTTLDAMRNTILSSIYGRRLGLDSNQFLLGAKSFKVSSQATLTSTGTSILNFGITGINLTTAAASTASSVGTTEVGASLALDAPSEGVLKHIYNANTTGSTMSVVVEFGTGVTANHTSLGTTFTGFTMWAPGQQVTLLGLSTAKWQIIATGTGTSFASSN